jgi:trk system potassium uptake protein
MRVIIVGCGRVGALTAAELDQGGDQVTVIDQNPRAFNRLPTGFSGDTVRGNGTDEDVVRTAGAEQADLLMALTEGDNRNALAAQVAKHTFHVPRVIAKINDPLRAEAYRALGLETMCRTVILSNALITATRQGAEATNGAVEPPTAEPMRISPLVAGFSTRADQRAEDQIGASEAGAGEAGLREADIVQPRDGQSGGL